MATKKWIQGAIKHPGALTRKAHMAGMSTMAYIDNPPARIDASTKKQINLAKTLIAMTKKRSKSR